MKKRKRPELIAPAGSLEKLKMAYRMGADGCYIGTNAYSMRTGQNAIGQQHLEEAKQIAEQYGKKLYVCVNSFPHNSQLEGLKKHLTFLNQLKPDAVVFADPSVIMLAKEIGMTDVPFHLSVQSSTANYLSVKFWQASGISRVILARELTLNEIAGLKENVPEMELEAFVHGAVCMAYSGRCFLSTVFSHRDANQGMCAHNCRDGYRVTSATIQNVYYEEQQMEIEEDEHGSHLMSSQDMCLLPHLDKLIDAGIGGFKIEGRNKTEYYLAMVVRCYREAIDRVMDGKPIGDDLMEELKRTNNRGFFSGFYFPELEEQSEVGRKEEHGPLQWYAAYIEEVDGNRLTVRVKSNIYVGKKLRLLSEKYGKEKELMVTGIENMKGEPLEKIASGMKGIVVVEEPVDDSFVGLPVQHHVLTSS